MSIESRRSKSSRRGIVLLMTVAMIALASAALTRLANDSLSLVARGTVAQRELQRRWTHASCRLTILNRAQDLFRQREAVIISQGAGWPRQADMQLSFAIAHESLSIILSDEQARANVNMLNRKNEQRLYTELARVAAGSAVPLRFSPAPTDNSPTPAFSSWGQIIDFRAVSESQSIADTLSGIKSNFTCWGDGRINICRASDDVVRLALFDMLSAIEIEKLLEARRGHSGTLNELVTSLDIHRQKQIRLQQAVVEDSNCFSMTITQQRMGRETTTIVVNGSKPRAISPPIMFRW